MTKRILHVSAHSQGNCLFASDFNGVIYKLSPKLEVIAQSDGLPGRISVIYVITCNNLYVYGRDMLGNLIQWNTSDLSLKKILYLSNFTADDTPNENVRYPRSFAMGDKGTGKVLIPTVSHGLFLWADRVCVNNPFGELLQFTNDTLQFIKRTRIPSDANFVESCDTTLAHQHVISDCSGYFYFGHLDERAFQRCLRLDFGPVHCVRYDSLHQRYWMTTDNHRGFSIVSEDGTQVQRVQITNDDCEWLSFTSDNLTVYVACFDHHLYQFDNSNKTPRLIRKIGPFKFQLKQVLNIDPDHTYVLLESGEIYCLGYKGVITHEAPFGSNCIWDIVKDKTAENTILCPLEDGGLCKVHYNARPGGSYNLRVVEHLAPFGFGRMRRVISLSDGSFIAGCGDGTVFRAGADGSLLWHYKTRAIVRDIAVNDSEMVCVAVNEAGVVSVFETNDGKLRWTLTFNRPLWATTFYGEDLLVSERCMSDEDQWRESTVPYGSLYRIDATNKNIKLRVVVLGNIKRIKVLDNGHILFNGNGDITAVEYDLENTREVMNWSQWQLNTCESVVKFKGYVHTVTYGYQLNSYREDGQLINSQFSPDNYPKAIYAEETIDGIPILLVAGRGPYVSLYHLRDGIPDVAATLYVH